MEVESPQRGLGTSIEVGYIPITFNAIYGKDTTSVCPFVDFKSAMPVT